MRLVCECRVRGFTVGVEVSFRKCSFEGQGRLTVSSRQEIGVCTLTALARNGWVANYHTIGGILRSRIPTYRHELESTSTQPDTETGPQD